MGAAAVPIMGLQVAGSMMSAYGAYQSGHANAAILRMNAEYARTQAAEARQAGEYQAGIVDIKEAGMAGAEASSFAGQGVVAGAGSAASVVTTSAAVSEADKAMLRLNASRQAYGFEMQATNDQFQADMAIRGASWGAATSVVQGAGQAAFTGAMLN